jgi:hypothetical protein
MPQKEDILEQIVEEYLIHRGYFVQRNIKYRPDRIDPEYEAKKDSVRSDIDVLAFNPRVKSRKQVLVFNIKSYQAGFNFRAVINQIESNTTVRGRDARLAYRELCIPRWSKAFIEEIRSRTNMTRFTYVLAITLPKGDPSIWTTHPRFVAALSGNPIEVLPLKQMIEEIEPLLTTTPAATDIGRTLQLFRAAGLRPQPQSSSKIPNSARKPSIARLSH